MVAPHDVNPMARLPTGVIQPPTLLFAAARLFAASPKHDGRQLNVAHHSNFTSVTFFYTSDYLTEF